MRPTVPYRDIRCLVRIHCKPDLRYDNSRRKRNLGTKLTSEQTLQQLGSPEYKRMKQMMQKNAKVIVESQHPQQL